MRCGIRATLSAGFVVLLCAGPAWGLKVIHVATTGNDLNDGLSWATAKRTVQAGLDAAAGGNQTWVAAGTYTERITLTIGTALYGGFAGNETDLSQRNWTVNKTILDGNQGGTVVTALSFTGATTRIDGFTIQNGSGTVSGTSTRGGGIYCNSGSPTIANNTITGNTASNGGGVYCYYSSATITNNTITGNTVYSGGGIYCYHSSATITNNTVAGNTSTSGGGIFCDASSPTIANNAITRNAASNFGGGIRCGSSSPTVVNSTIVGNTASDAGGMFCDSYSSPTIANTIIAFNAGGVYVGGACSLRFNCVYGNAADNYSGIADPTGKNGNISVDPGIVGWQYGAYWHIRPASPCVGAGDDSAVQSGWLDLDGQARIQGTHVDIGADESDGAELAEIGPNVIVRVSPDGNDTSDGSTWSAAKRTVQAAINSVSVAGGEVWVKAGIYAEQITLRPYAHVYGGFDGAEAARAERDFRANVTVLDGQQRGSVVTAQLLASGLSTIDGFTIRNGSSFGVSCSSSSPTVANNTITGNTDAGIFCSYGWATVVNNVIMANRGGGIRVSSAFPTITNNTIVENAAGGINCYYSSPTIENTIIAFNVGGVSVGGASWLRCNCVYGNTAYNYSGISDPTGTNGNLSADPGLAGWQYGHWHILPTSPCVDAGDDSVVEPGSLDVDAQPRIQGSHVDIGADESDGTVWPEGPGLIVRISPDGNDANDGSNWQAAKRTVQAGIDAAAAVGGEVWVRAGTYAQRVTLRAGAHVYGGFAGAETMRDQRDFRANVTILDGQGGGSVVTVQSVVLGLSTIDGFTIRNGKASTGGGIFCSSSSPTIANNTITDNAASSSLSYDTRGGGIYCCSSSSPAIVNNTVMRNIAGEKGGGIYLSASSPAIANNVITDNTAPFGGGICCESSSPMIVNNTIAANAACSSFSDSSAAGGYGGGIYCYSSSFPTVVNTVVAFNSSGIWGGDGSMMRHNCVYGNTRYNYSGLADPTGTNGNISTDPGLAGWQYGNVHIQPGSACADAGEDGVVVAGSLDLDGQPRIQGLHADIGADESDGTLWPQGPAVTVRVSPDGNDASDGSSWSAAKRTVQAGIDAAATAGGEVWVKAGAYPERIVLRSYAHVYGGFGGAETAREQRDFHANLTILDGQRGGSVVTAQSPGYGLSTVDGFTIRNGSGTRFGYYTCGAGIYCSSSSPTIANNRITENAADHGGGICCEASAATIANNTIIANSASSYGGGIECLGSSLTVADNTIVGNSAFRGAAVYCASYASTLIVNNTIAANTAAPLGGCVYLEETPTIVNTIIAFNSSGICHHGSGQSTLRFNCVYGNVEYNYSELTDVTGTNGNISADPRFADRSYGNLHIQPDSPCANAGDDSLVRADWMDMDGQPRIQGAHVDIGADESDGTLYTGGPGVIIRVSPDGSDANNGSSWLAAKRTVQGGIDAAAASGGDVWVRAGTYLERITLRVATHVYGGFSGTEAARDQRDFRTNVTVLDGQHGGSVVTASSVGCALSTVDGITLRNGTGTVSGADSYGGGIYCSFCWPTIANCAVTGNTASYGAGIYCSYASPMIANNFITGDTASRCGGAVHCYSSSPTVTNNVISTNTAGWGGGIFCEHSSCPTIANNMISTNTAGSAGGGIACHEASNSTITNNTIANNRASTDGGGVHCDGASPMIANNTIESNTASSDGGGVYCSLASPTIANSAIVGNSASHYGGGVYCQNGSSPLIAGSTITGNAASAEGGGVYVDSSSPMIANTIIAFNSSGVYRKAGGTGGPGLKSNCVYGNAAYNYSGTSDWTGVSGNISADPAIAGWQYGKWHIQPGSPCVNAGDDTMVQASWLDLDAQPRAQGSHVDIGADESDGTTWPAEPSVIVRVTPDGNDANDGSTWAAAKRTVQAGIDAASAARGDVWVKGGTYTERITLRPCAHLYGGFSGAEVAMGQRDFQANATVLDAQQSGSVVTVQSPGYRFSAIDGFTIRNGTGTTVGANRCGGGIYCSLYSPTIANNTITGSTASYGAGIYCYSGCLAAIVNNAITGNTASSYGGGVCCDQYAASPTIANNRISGNTAAGGAGISCWWGSPTIASNTITGNTTASSGSGGGILCYDDANPTIANNAIVGNTASAGGGISCVTSFGKIANNTITGNVASTSGGGIYCFSSFLTVANTIIAFNSSGVYVSANDRLTLTNGCVYGNPAYNYSGITDPTGTNGNLSVDPLFVRNAGPGPDGTWGTADDDYGDLHLGVGAPCIDKGDNAAVPAAITADLDANARIVDGDYDGVATVDMGAYEAGPLPMIQITPGALTLTARQRSNPPDDQFSVRNMGGGTLAYTVTTDGSWLSVTPDSGSSTGEEHVVAVHYATAFLLLGTYHATITIGAPGAGNTPQTIGVTLTVRAIPADFDGDGDTDLADFNFFQMCFAGPNRLSPHTECGPADLDGDADVDLNDFAIFQNCFNGPNRMPKCQ